MTFRTVLATAALLSAGCASETPHRAAPDATAVPAASPEAAAPSEVVAVPPHTVVDNTFLPPDRGRRIHLQVESLITKDECRALAAKYRDQARPGQVAVKLVGEGPLCVENFDGRGVTVHDFMWK